MEKSRSKTYREVNDLWALLIDSPPFDLRERSIILCYRGSIAHGTYIPNNDPDSIDDKDVMGVAIPPDECVFGLKGFEQFERQKDGWDVVIYDFRKFIRLLIKGNPNVMQVLWTPKKHILLNTWQGELLQKNRDLFVHKGVYKSFCGYAYGQLKRMEHLAYKGYMGEKRKALVQKFGYDCKNGQHLIRLLRQGIEFLNTGTLNVERIDKDELIAIKTGQWGLDRIKRVADGLFKEMEKTRDDTKLPDQPDFEKIHNLTMEIMRKSCG